jgi:hypothetical protein
MTKNKTLKEATEKELMIAFLEKRIERKTGKRVVYESKNPEKNKTLTKEQKIKVLEAAIEKITGKKVVYENAEEKEPVQEGWFWDSPEEKFKKYFEQTAKAWMAKGYKLANTDSILKAAKADNFAGKLGVDAEKNIIYRPASQIKWSNEFAGGGTGSMGTGVSK